MFRHGTYARSAPLRGIMHDKRALMTSSSEGEHSCETLFRQASSHEKISHKHIHACRVVARMRAASVRILHALLVVGWCSHSCFLTLTPVFPFFLFSHSLLEQRVEARLPR